MILQENLQDPTRIPIGYKVVIYMIINGHLGKKDHRLASSYSNQEVGAIPSHIFQLKK